MIVFDAQGKKIRLGALAGRGGEAVVYQVPQRPFKLAKIYTPAPRSNYADKLSWMVDHPPVNPTERLGHHSMAWPVELVYERDRSLTGYLMPYIQGAAPILEVFNPRRRAETLPGFDRRYLLRTARNLATTIRALHRSGYVAGDLNENNVLVTPSALVTLIDTDSFQVREERNGERINHACPVGKFEYTPPELQGQAVGDTLRLPEHDAFALAVLVFQLLMEGSHPFRAQWLGSGDPPPIETRIAQGLFPHGVHPSPLVQPPRFAPELDSLHPGLVDLFRRCFADGHTNPAMRPSPGAWQRALAQAEKSLAMCSQGHYYPDHLAACPDCTPPKQSQPAPARAVQPQPQTAPRPQAAPRPQPAPTAAPPSPRPSGSFRRRSWQRQAPPFIRRTPPPMRPSRASRPAPSPAPAGLPFQIPWPAVRKIALDWFLGRAGSSQPPAGSFPSYTPARTGWGPLFQVPDWQELRQRSLKSVMVGGSLGALAGMLLSAVVNLAAGSFDQAVLWSLLWAAGGAAAGLLRGWKPAYRFGQWVDLNIGWVRFWRFAGLVLGGFGGLMLGMLFWWAIFPIFIGLFAGARYGWTAGEKLWRIGERYEWARIWAFVGAGSTAAIGWALGSWIGGSAAGGYTSQIAGAFSAWLSGFATGPGVLLAASGAIAGAFGGLISGTFADLFGRLSGLVD